MIPKTRYWITLILLAVVPIQAAEPDELSSQLINFSDREDLIARRPIIIAHRGGVVSPHSAECSVTAIGLAADAGYDMVELDIQKSRDGVPMVFHDRTLKKACGREGRVEDLASNELESMSYLVGDDRIIRLDTALALCRRLRLGVMLDLKSGRDTQAFLEEIDRLIVKHGLQHATISISGSTAARRFLKHVRFTPTKEEMDRLRAGEILELRHRFWFGLPQQLQPQDVTRLKSSGALILPAINTFRYPADSHAELAKSDIERLIKEGVDGFQIDSMYFAYVEQDE